MEKDALKNHAPAAELHADTAELWLTKTDGSVLFQRQPGPLKFEAQAGVSRQDIEIDPGVTYQEIDGFGCTLTGGSALLIQGLPETERASLLRELFATDGAAIGLSYLRLSIGASDLDERVFSYDDLSAGQQDVELADFSIGPDKKAVIPVLKQILAINPGLKLLASPWSPPVWMKTNGKSKGGSLKPEYYEVYARYLAAYIKAMRAEGINIDALTVQNEPLNPDNNPSMVMTAAEQGLFIKKYLGPLFKKYGLKTKIVLYDHNCDKPEYPLSILADKEAARYVDGSAFHMYGGEVAAMSLVHNAHPDKNIYFTEQWVGGPSNFAADFKWHVKTLVIGAVRNWSKNVMGWNLASDPAYGPHTEGGCDRCQGALTIGRDIKRDVAYYVLAHASKFVRPGSLRIKSNLPPSLPNVAFKTPFGKIVLIVLNEKSAPASFNIQYKGKAAAAALPGDSAGTYVIGE
ncbi:MAG: glucosylceramidase [Elusimicrobia bacterium GWA2_56_46]|nr:MAG: glucosylceramidase [Elusimicrobia bacterium GWA2_56_46]OGR55947.1 MAG: glucosylceramidase [Elusimicrobia bacterium GWC2_56_31]